MLLRNSISSTRKFFKRTLGRFKYLFSGGHYQKLPKSPLSLETTLDSATISDGQQLSFKDMNNAYTETNITPNKVITVTDHIVDDCQSSSSISENNKIKKTARKLIDKEYSRALVVSDNNNDNNNILVEQKLKELEMLDKSNGDHDLDIEEVLHYYSRLTCPAYLEIVDKFFAEILSEFFNSDPPR